MASPLPFLASPTRPPQTTPANGLSDSSRVEERNPIIQNGDVKNTSGYDGRTSFFNFYNVFLSLCFIFGVCCLAMLLVLQVGPLLGMPECKRHVDHYLGRMWIECPEVAAPRFGPRRY